MSGMQAAILHNHEHYIMNNRKTSNTPWSTLLLLLGLLLSSLTQAADNNRQVLQFIVIGDWGMQGAPAQRRVAEQMDRLAATTGIDFIVSTGDNFYPFGVRNTNDPLWLAFAR